MSRINALVWFSEPAAAKKLRARRGEAPTSNRAQTVPASSISTDTAEASGEWRTTLDIQTHSGRGGVPTARRQALEERALSSSFVRVKGCGSS